MSGSVASAFDVALRQQNAKITPHDLLQQFPPPSSSSASPLATPLSECRFYEDFTTAPSDANEKAKLAIDDAIATHGQEHVDAVLASGTHHALRRHRQFDFRLNEDETARLAQHGFMVSERLRAESFAEVYYRLYSDDMPVFITSDSVLHAWHRSFDAFLVELEEEELTPLLEKILDDVRQASERTTPSLAAASVARDVDTFFAVAHALLLGSIDSEKTDAATILDGIQCEQLTTVTLFGTSREVDFSLFKPRGRYTKSPELGRFFRAMTWLGTADFRVAGTDDPASERHQLQCACRVVQLLRDAQVLKRVEAFATILSVLTGDGYGADSMTPMQLHALLGDRDLEALYLSGDSETHLQDLQDEIANHRLGAQAIAGHPLTESVAAAASPSLPTRLPTSFAFLGQQFVWTAFVFSKLVYDQVLDEHQNKVARRLPSAVDAAFAVLGNNGATSELATRMTATPKTSSGFVPFRDGLPYAASLVAVRHVVDATLATAEPASCSVALLWQLALRELSAASASNATVFQSHAWAKRTMNTQLASLAQLRHDTILYAKQSFTMGTRCEYAAGFVDPYPAFWHRMQQLAQRSRDIVGQLRALSADDDESMVQYRARDFFDNFADVTRQLGEIATAQATKQPLRDEQDEFIKNVMEERHGSGGSRYMGWYPSLFYAHREDSGKKDHVVADIHTDVPSVEHGDPGGILHTGVGDVNMGFFVVDKVMYAGPVFSHYEFVTPINARLTDEEFSERLSEFQAPTWATESFLVPN